MTPSLRVGERPRHLDLFSGIGGFALSAKWAGFETVQFVEIEPFCRRVLEKNFPGVPCHDDIRTYDATQSLGRIDLITGGFPCQDISAAGKGAGIDGERSGLWREMLRCVRECRPLFMLAENSDRLRTRGSDRLLGDLEGIGYAARSFVVGAGNAGAPHLRSRAFVVAYDQGVGRGALWAEPAARDRDARTADCPHARMGADPCGFGHRVQESTVRARRNGAFDARWREFEPPVPGVVHGLPGRMDRVRALGNAVVPQMAYVFLKAIAEQILADTGKVEKDGE